MFFDILIMSRKDKSLSTRSAILEKTETGYRGIYCHNDGYVEGVGITLLEHYTDPAKVSSLIDLGDISSLGELVDPQPNTVHSFENPDYPIVTVAYGRDRGESDTEATVGKTIKQVANKIDHAYLYVFENGRWSVDGRPLDLMLLKLES